MATVLASDLIKRKKEIVFVEGYWIDCANELTGAIDAAQDVIHVYGDDDPILDVNVNNATLTLSVYDKKENNILLDALQQDDPDDNSNKQYNWNNIYPTSVWANRLNVGNTQYLRSAFYKNWLPIPAMVTGDANAKGTRSFAGNAEAVKEFNQPIIGQKIALVSGAGGVEGYVGTLAYTPLQVPDESVYALRVVAIEEARSGTHITKFNTEELVITTSMVESDKTVTIKQSDINIVDGPNYAYVNYLYDKSLGVYPTLTGSGMFTANV